MEIFLIKYIILYLCTLDHCRELVGSVHKLFTSYTFPCGHIFAYVVLVCTIETCEKNTFLSTFSSSFLKKLEIATLHQDNHSFFCKNAMEKFFKNFEVSLHCVNRLVLQTFFLKSICSR